jgi:hypothetical protein
MSDSEIFIIAALLPSCVYQLAIGYTSGEMLSRGNLVNFGHEKAPIKGLLF